MPKFHVIMPERLNIRPGQVREWVHRLAAAGLQGFTLSQWEQGWPYHADPRREAALVAEAHGILSIADGVGLQAEIAVANLSKVDYQDPATMSLRKRGERPELLAVVRDGGWLPDGRRFITMTAVADRLYALRLEMTGLPVAVRWYSPEHGPNNKFIELTGSRSLAAGVHVLHAPTPGTSGWTLLLRRTPPSPPVNGGEVLVGGLQETDPHGEDVVAPPPSPPVNGGEVLVGGLQETDPHGEDVVAPPLSPPVNGGEGTYEWRGQKGVPFCWSRTCRPEHPANVERLQTQMRNIVREFAEHRSLAGVFAHGDEVPMLGWQHSFQARFGSAGEGYCYLAQRLAAAAQVRYGLPLLMYGDVLTENCVADARAVNPRGGGLARFEHHLLPELGTRLILWGAVLESPENSIARRQGWIRKVVTLGLPLVVGCSFEAGPRDFVDWARACRREQTEPEAVYFFGWDKADAYYTETSLRQALIHWRFGWGIAN